MVGRAAATLGRLGQASRQKPGLRRTLDFAPERWHDLVLEGLMDKVYIDTVRLLLQAIPHVFRSKDFALKGGTALNLFVQDMPRLSVDLDIAFVDRSVDRETALDRIRAALSETRLASEPLI
jgi:hypothetical protein